VQKIAVYVELFDPAQGLTAAAIANITNLVLVSRRFRDILNPMLWSQISLAWNHPTIATCLGRLLQPELANPLAIVFGRPDYTYVFTRITSLRLDFSSIIPSGKKAATYDWAGNADNITQFITSCAQILPAANSLERLDIILSSLPAASYPYSVGFKKCLADLLGNVKLTKIKELNVTLRRIDQNDFKLQNLPPLVSSATSLSISSTPLGAWIPFVDQGFIRLKTLKIQLTNEADTEMERLTFWNIVSKTTTLTTLTTSVPMLFPTVQCAEQFSKLAFNHITSFRTPSGIVPAEQCQLAFSTIFGMPNLEYLSIALSPAGDFVLPTRAIACRQLKTLVVHHPCPINLYQTIFSQCQLSSLTIWDTDIADNFPGCSSIIYLGLPQCKLVSYECLKFPKIQRILLDTATVWTLGVEGLKVLFKVCPSLVVIEIQELHGREDMNVRFAEVFRMYLSDFDDNGEAGMFIFKETWKKGGSQ
jgi:hypothetical protein